MKISTLNVTIRSNDFSGNVRFGQRVWRAVISVISVFVLFSTAWAESRISVDLTEGFPRSYTVREGDTLWDIASQFLRRPWQWVEVWQEGDALYPGDVLIISAGKNGPRIKVLKVEKRGPRVRVITTAQPVPTIAPDTVRPFLEGPMIMDPVELSQAGQVVSGIRDDVVLGQHDRFFAAGLPTSASGLYRVVRMAESVIDPDTGETLGSQTIDLGTARLVSEGLMTTLELVTSHREVSRGDFLVATNADQNKLPHFTLRRPRQDVTGRIVSSTTGFGEFSRLDTVMLSLGKRDWLREGDVLEIWRPGQSVTDPTTGKLVTTPGEPVGYVMAYRVYDKFSHGLILECRQPAQMYDYVRRPDA
ncbi:MAG: LysM domain-containing protein [Arenicellales bacterium]|nr:LysM domain-containing protein [Arenicellales bacterium]